MKVRVNVALNENEVKELIKSKQNGTYDKSEKQNNKRWGFRDPQSEI